MSLASVAVETHKYLGELKVELKDYSTKKFYHLKLNKVLSNSWFMAPKFVTKRYILLSGMSSFLRKRDKLKDNNYPLWGPGRNYGFLISLARLKLDR